MQLEHSFSVPVGIDEAWRVLLDIERIAPCIPGATIESIDGDEITGAIKVKLGAIGPTYKGTATLAEKDAAGHRAVINAHGDTRANGSATAKITATLSEFGGSTSVMLMTDVDFTGKPAELEHAIISDAGARVIRQFAERLSALLAEAATAEPTTAEPTAEPTTAEPTIAEPTIAEPTIAEPTAEEPNVEPPTAEPTTPRHANSHKPRVEVVPDEPKPGAAPLAKRLAPVGIVVVVLLLLRRRRRRRRR